jgi:EpsD family peptidyl-prolyl cis-trans isomerase
MIKLSPRLSGAAIAVAVAVTLVGCKGNNAASAPSQVVVKVDDAEISVHQLNAVLLRLPSLTADELEQKKAEVIDTMIDQQITANQAIKLKLDRTPDALILLEAARDQMLSQLYLAEYAQQLPRPLPADVQKYYREHAYAYGARKEYVLLQLTIPAASEEAKSKWASQKDGRALVDMGTSLRADNVPHQLSVLRIASDAMSAELASALSTQDVGAIVPDPVRDADLRVYEVKQIKEMSLDFADVKTAIEQKLYSDKVTASVPDQLKRLRQTAKVEYVGDFSKYSGMTAQAHQDSK